MPVFDPDHPDMHAAAVNADLRRRGVTDLRFDTPDLRARRDLAEGMLNLAAGASASAAPEPEPSREEARPAAPAPTPTPDPVAALRARLRGALALPEAWARPRQAVALALSAPIEGEALRAVLRGLPTDANAGPVDLGAAGTGETDPAARQEARRIAQIMGSAEAEGREAQAAIFALQTSMTPTDARAALGRMPKAVPVQTIAARAADEAEFGGSVEDASPGRSTSAADRAWGRAIAAVNGARP